jgi:hypothetical protein
MGEGGGMAGDSLAARKIVRHARPLASLARARLQTPPTLPAALVLARGFDPTDSHLRRFRRAHPNFTI